MFRMPDRAQPLVVKEDQPPIDWHAAAPTLDLRWLFGVALLMPLLLAAGVFWLHHMPAGSGPRDSDSVIEIRLINVVEPPQPVNVASLPPSIAPGQASEPQVDEPRQSIPEPAAVPPSPEPLRASEPPKASAPAASAAAVRAPTSPKAAVFQRTLLSHIARYRTYPDQARRDHAQGTVLLVFAMRRDGTVSDVWVKTSSGYHALDRAAVDTIRNAQPLPRIPSDLPDQLNISMPVTFNLQ